MKSKNTFDFNKFAEASKALADSIDSQYPNIKPPEEFIWYYSWSEAGIEEKQSILYQALSDIYEYLNKHELLKDNKEDAKV